MKKISRLLLLLALVSTLLVWGMMSASAETLTGVAGDNITYTIDTETGEMVLSGEGPMYDYKIKDGMDYDVWDEFIPYPEAYTVKSIVIEDGITSIGGGAFYSFSSLETVSIPDSVTSIGDYAFWCCSELKSIDIPENVTYIGYIAFERCTDLEAISIPDGVTELEPRTFEECIGIKTLNLNNVTVIGEDALSWLTGLETITVAEDNPAFEVGSDGVLYSEDMTELVMYPVASRNTSYVLPEIITKVPDFAFECARYLNYVTLHDKVTELGTYAFAMSAIREIDLPDSLKTIGEGCFYFTDLLKEIKIPAGVTTICDAAFFSYYPKDITFEDKDVTIGSECFSFLEGLSEEYREAFVACLIELATQPQSCSSTHRARFAALEEELNSYIEGSDVVEGHGGTFHCHSGSTAEAYAIENGISYELIHFYGEDWTYDWDNYTRTAKCIHCDETTTEALEKTESSDIEIVAPEDEDTTFTVENVADEADERYALVTESVENYEGNISVVKIFDITLKNNDGVHVQPDGSVKVKLPNDWKHENYKVFRVNDDGTYTDMNAYREGSHIVFVTDHFSLYVVVDTSEKHEHSYNGVVTTPATHLATGLMTYTCSCGDSYTETIEKDPTHSYKSAVTAPTCTEKGFTTYSCACGDSHKDDYVNAKGHNYDGDTCTGCGKSKIDNCDCNCHKSGFMGFIYKIQRFFWKLFKTNKTCGCGVIHY